MKGLSSQDKWLVGVGIKSRRLWCFYLHGGEEEWDVICTGIVILSFRQNLLQSNLILVWSRGNFLIGVEVVPGP
jgi:hypothetical protein